MGHAQGPSSWSCSSSCSSDPIPKRKTKSKNSFSMQPRSKLQDTSKQFNVQCCGNAKFSTLGRCPFRNTTISTPSPMLISRSAPDKNASFITLSASSHVKGAHPCRTFSSRSSAVNWSRTGCINSWKGGGRLGERNGGAEGREEVGALVEVSRLVRPTHLPSATARGGHSIVRTNNVVAINSAPA